MLRLAVGAVAMKLRLDVVGKPWSAACRTRDANPDMSPDHVISAASRFAQYPVDAELVKTFSMGKPA